jgi:hypothetical protein
VAEDRNKKAAMRFIQGRQAHFSLQLSLIALRTDRRAASCGQIVAIMPPSCSTTLLAVVTA